MGGKERGNSAFAEGRWQEAYDAYSASLAADPDLKAQFVAQVGGRNEWVAHGGAERHL